VKPVHAPAGLVQLSMREARLKRSRLERRRTRRSSRASNTKTYRAAYGKRRAKKNCAMPWKKPSITAATSPSRARTAALSKATSSTAAPGRLWPIHASACFPKAVRASWPSLTPTSRASASRDATPPRARVGKPGCEVLGKESRRRKEYRADPGKPQRGVRGDPTRQALPSPAGWPRHRPKYPARRSARTTATTQGNRAAT
jgi:hypothetical protein